MAADAKTTPARTPARSAAQKAAKARRDAGKRAGEKIDVKLAHHLGEDNPYTEDGEPKNPGDTLNVTRAQARELLSAGYLQCDPEDPEQIRATLKLEDPEADAIATASGPGGGGQ